MRWNGWWWRWWHRTERHRSKSRKIVCDTVNSAILTDDVNEEWSCYDHPSPSAVGRCGQLIFAIIVVDVVVWFTLRWTTVCHFCFSVRFRFLSTLAMLFLLITLFYLKSLPSGISSLRFCFFTLRWSWISSPAFLLIDSSPLLTCQFKSLFIIVPFYSVYRIRFFPLSLFFIGCLSF